MPHPLYHQISGCYFQASPGGVSDGDSSSQPSSIGSNVGEADIRETFAIIQQYGGGALTDKHARVLVSLLTSQSQSDDVIRVLIVIQNCAAFSSSQVGGERKTLACPAPNLSMACGYLCVIHIRNNTTVNLG